MILEVVEPAGRRLGEGAPPRRAAGLHPRRARLGRCEPREDRHPRRGRLGNGAGDLLLRAPRGDALDARSGATRSALASSRASRYLPRRRFPPPCASKPDARARARRMPTLVIVATATGGLRETALRAGARSTPRPSLALGLQGLRDRDARAAARDRRAGAARRARASARSRARASRSRSPRGQPTALVLRLARRRLRRAPPPRRSTARACASTRATTWSAWSWAAR